MPRVAVLPRARAAQCAPRMAGLAPRNQPPGVVVACSTAYREGPAACPTADGRADRRRGAGLCVGGPLAVAAGRREAPATGRLCRRQSTAADAGRPRARRPAALCAGGIPGTL